VKLRQTPSLVRHERRPRTLHRTGVIALVAIATLSACGRQVSVEPPNPSTADVMQRCSQLVAALPDTVDGAARRPTTPESPTTAAWGEPPIVLRCGVSAPSAFTPTSTVVEIGGIAWFPEELTAGVIFTTTDWPSDAEAIYVEVAVPDRYESPAAIVTDISMALFPR
jgi:hypothetical protein